MTMGEPGKNGVRNHEEKDCQEILDVFFNHGHTELDTARMYAEGTTEAVSLDSVAHALSDRGAWQYLASLDLRSATIDTK
jgi:aflatoxin B1 aldehyde reductase